ncbi:MAG: lytic transglycosylase [Gammaproteobacteria bacterium]|nr:MAG: lytic transglycosylase [Gammaproteobacteria bacterium]RKZ44412.1 MAG: lytic transglycosylase [Gammaproteobacteria bacterium]RKZ74650.1 MAG: lytic transglycosylase [Gammaproteobacteria bacterium]
MKSINLIYIVLMIIQPVLANSISTKTTIIYKYFDTKGVLHLTTQPPKKHHQLEYARSYLITSYQPPLVLNLHGKKHRKYKNYQLLIEAAAKNARLSPALLHAVVQVESNYNPKAVSPKGAVGLMQLMPATAKRYGVTDRTDPIANLNGGARYLFDLLTLFNNDLSLALAAYNAGENAVKRYGNTIPPYKETKNYVKKVKKLYYQNNHFTEKY